MQIGWREFINDRFKKASKFHSVGIEFGVSQFQIATLAKTKGQLSWVKQHSTTIDNWQSKLKSYVIENQLGNTQCNIALSISKYQLFQLDRPEVKDEELNQALQWAAKEHLSTDEQHVIDYFDLPVVTSNVKKLNVVAIKTQDILDIRDGILGAGLMLNMIGIEELANCNLLPENDEAVITLKQDESGQLSLNIVKQNKLFFSRRLRGYENLANLSPEELKMGVVDNLSLEIQRSMDYFESQLRQAPVKKVYLSIDTPHQVPLAEFIKDVLFVTVESFVPNIAKDSSMPIKPSSIASLGAAIDSTSLIA